MKILHIMTSCSTSSASYRLHLALVREGISSKCLALSTNLKDTNINISKSKKNIVSHIFRKIDSMSYSLYKKRIFPFSSSFLRYGPLIQEIDKINPDIVHIHWMNGGFLKISDLLMINKPIVFSMHDNWIFTGGCHVKLTCENFIEYCGKCKVLGSDFKYDLSNLLWKLKKKNIDEIKNITFIGLSKWMFNEAKRSSLLKNKRVINIPNPINVNEFFYIDKSIARKKLKLNDNKKYLIFGAVDALNDINKGFHILKNALCHLKHKYELLIFGNQDNDELFDVTIKTHYFGYIRDLEILRYLYSAADVMIVPSLQENLSNAIMESLSCGTPVVAFDIGGNSDMIEHKVNGYLAKPYDPFDLSNGINFILNSDNSEKLAINARNKIVNNFESSLVAKKYIELYESILNHE